MSGENNLVKHRDPASTADRLKNGNAEMGLELQKMVNGAQSGDREAATWVGVWIKAVPNLADALRANIGKVVKDSLISWGYGKDSLANAEAIRHRMGLMRAEFCGPNPTVVEGLLAERVVVCRLDCHFEEHRDIKGKDWAIAQADLAGRQRDQAH